MKTPMPRGAIPPEAASVKTLVSIPDKKPKDGRTKLIGNLGAYAHPPKGKKK